MNCEEARKKADELIRAQGEGQRNVSRFKVVAKDPNDVTRGWSVERPIGDHTPSRPAAD